VSSLDLLDELASVIDPSQRVAIIDWIYSLQLHPHSGAIFPFFLAFLLLHCV
jgi:hypothetical protein